MFSRSSLIILAGFTLLVPAQAQSKAMNDSSKALSLQLAKPVPANEGRPDNKPYSLDVIDDKTQVLTELKSETEKAMPIGAGAKMSLKLHTAPEAGKSRNTGLKIMDGQTELGKVTLIFTNTGGKVSCEVKIHRNESGKLKLDPDNSMFHIQN